MIPNAFYYPRGVSTRQLLDNLVFSIAFHFRLLGTLTVEKMREYAETHEFTHLMVLSEKSKICNGILLTHLGGNGKVGPTAFFRVRLAI